MKSSELLRLAADKFLWDGRSARSSKAQYLCLAVSNAAHAAAPDPERVTMWAQPRAAKVRERIGQRLGNSTTVRGWLYARGYLETDLCDNLFAEVQAYRKRWAYHLASEFEQEGD